MQNWKIFARSSDWDFLLVNRHLRLKTLHFYVFSHVEIYLWIGKKIQGEIQGWGIPFWYCVPTDLSFYNFIDNL